MKKTRKFYHITRICFCLVLRKIRSILIVVCKSNGVISFNLLDLRWILELSNT